MSYNISSDNLDNPLLKELLTKLTGYFESIGSDFYIIGATARDIVLSSIHKQPLARRTVDLDIAIAIPNWDKFNEISKGLCRVDGFEKSKKQQQRFLYRNLYVLDIVPFGEVAKEDKSIYWPPDEQFAMSVLGFTEVAKDTLDVVIDGNIKVKVASLPGIFILKLAAFKDRGQNSNKDADDMAFIISGYLHINQERAAAEHYGIYLREDFSTFIAGATLLGHDIKMMLEETEDTLAGIAGILKEEVDKAENSLLINQMVETNRIQQYDEVLEALQCLLAELRKDTEL